MESHDVCSVSSCVVFVVRGLFVISVQVLWFLLWDECGVEKLFGDIVSAGVRMSGLSWSLEELASVNLVSKMVAPKPTLPLFWNFLHQCWESKIIFSYILTTLVPCLVTDQTMPTHAGILVVRYTPVGILWTTYLPQD